MVNEIVKYKPELNTIPLRKFSPIEMNLFFSIVSRMRDQGDNKVRFTFEQLKELSNYKATANNRFIDDIQNTYKKIMQLQFGSRSESGLTREMFVMFTEFKIDGEAEIPYVDIKIYDKALHLLNNLESWVRYSLAEFRELKSSYSKTTFRLLKQYRTTGVAYFTKQEFKELLDIPESYKPGDIDRRILKPVKEELTPIFKGLTIRKRYGHGPGKPILGYKFSWSSELKNADDFNKDSQKNIDQKLKNIKFNDELSLEEKHKATRRIIGKNESLDNIPDYINPIKLSDKQLEDEKSKLSKESSSLGTEILTLMEKNKLTKSEVSRLKKITSRYEQVWELLNSLKSTDNPLPESIIRAKVRLDEIHKAEENNKPLTDKSSNTKIKSKKKIDVISTLMNTDHDEEVLSEDDDVIKEKHVWSKKQIELMIEELQKQLDASEEK